MFSQTRRADLRRTEFSNQIFAAAPQKKGKISLENGTYSAFQ
jgi:hypothetical protein